MGRDFLKAVCICLLSPRAIVDQELERPDVAPLSKTPKPRMPLRRLENSAERASRSTRDKSSRTKAGKPTAPKFVSGYCDGRPVYTEIRVASDEAADGIWRQRAEATAAAGSLGL
jgi:hypothetical protein